MKREELLRAIGDIDENLISGAVEEPKKKRSRVRWGLIAACICLLVGTGIVAMASTQYGAQLISAFSGRQIIDTNGVYYGEENGFAVHVNVDLVPTRQLKGQINEVPAILKEQYERGESTLGGYPGIVQKEFATSVEAREYIGYAKLRVLAWDLEETTTWLQVAGIESGALSEIAMWTVYKAGNITLVANSYITMEGTYSPGVMRVLTSEDKKFVEETFTTSGGKQCLMVRSTADDLECMELYGYIVHETVVYELNVRFEDPADAEQAESLLHQWAEQLG